MFSIKKITLLFGLIFTIVFTQDDMELPPDPKVINKFKKDHGIILTIAWCFVADLGVFFKFARFIPLNVLLHIFCFLLVIAGTIYEVVESIKIFDPSYDFKTFPPISKGHLILALIICGILAIQIIAGFVSYLLQILTNVNPRVLKFFRWVHLIGGYFILILAKAQTIYGWVLYDNNTALVIVTAQIILLLALFMIYICQTNRITDEPNQYKLLRRPISQQQSILTNFLRSQVPYNSLALKNFNYFIYNDLVYLYNSASFHPGGRKIMNLVRGREVDRYIYGMYGVQQYPGLGRLLHPENSFDMLQKPIMLLPKNPAVQLGSDKFIIHKKTFISPTVALFQFQPARGEQIVYRQPKDLRHLGQYFKVAGYGFTRLYTCVIALTQQNRNRNLEMFSRLNINPITYNTRGPEKTFDQTINQDYTTTRNPMIQPQTTINLNNTFHRSYIIDQKPSLPLLIKKYPGKTFTNQLFNRNQMLHISGLKGRGMGIERINKGRVLLMSAGTGLYPFVDLLDTIFKIIVGDQTKLPCSTSHRMILQGLRFTLFGSFNQIHDMAIPTQLAVMSSFQHPMFNMMVKISKPLQPNESVLMSPFMSNFRFNQQFVKKHVLSIPEYDLSMIYICGPPVMYSAILGSLRKYKVSQDKIFLL